MENKKNESTPHLSAADRAFAENYFLEICRLLPWIGFDQILAHEGMAKLDKRDEDGKTVLMYAAETGHLKQVKKLVAEGINLNSRDDQGRTALMYAALAGHQDIVEHLCQHGARAKGSDDVLDMAAENGHFSVVEYLVKLRLVDISNIQNKIGGSALCWAVYHENLPAVRKLVGAGAKPSLSIYRNNLSPDDGASALHVACFRGDFDMVHYLIAACLVNKEYAMLNLQMKDGKTPLMLAQEKGHSEVVKYLEFVIEKEQTNVDPTAFGAHHV